MGIWIAFGFVAFMFVVMGRALYGTYRNGVDRDGSAPVALRLFDPIDMLIILFAWFLVLPALFDVMNLPLSGGLGRIAMLLFGGGIPWVRRRFFPPTLMPFRRKNVALRCLSLFCGLGVPITLLFAYFAFLLEERAATLWGFYILTGLLAVMAIGSFIAERRRLWAGPDSASEAQD